MIVMDEEKYNVNVVSAVSVDFPGKFCFSLSKNIIKCSNIWQFNPHESNSDWRSGPTMVTFVKVKVEA